MTIPTELPLRTIAAARAADLVGFTYPSADYLAAIAPGETPERALEMGRESGCALVAAAYLRALGLDGAPELAAPYRDGTAVSRLRALAQRLGAWSLVGSDGRCDVGDILVVEQPEHVTIVTAVDDAGHATTSVDGGQRTTYPDGPETVKARLRRQWAAGGRLLDQGRDDAEGAPWGEVRPVYARIDVEALCNAWAARA